MLESVDHDLRLSHRRLKLDTLVRLRWLAVAGQTAAVLFVYFVLGFPLPIGLCFALVALSAWLNVFLKIRSPATRRLSERSAAIQLGYDLLQMGGLLYLTGGLGNPFAFLLLAPVMVSATGLAAYETVLLGGLATLIASAVAVFHLPLPWPEGEIFVLPAVYSAVRLLSWPSMRSGSPRRHGSLLTRLRPANLFWRASNISMHSMVWLLPPPTSLAHRWPRSF